MQDGKFSYTFFFRVINPRNFLLVHFHLKFDLNRFEKQQSLLSGNPVKVGLHLIKIVY